ncbi:Rho GTPase activation protein [Cokeromyces recurvatus]|uniref:Rho GTPase activation protein n=1 Tax=Cokeromyces recurvatus TaxID=90255 RepID=UPI0022203E0C|nr:Rho GTPase activation protein [Cokeromyces recurvatus]KAI7905507.1 Rho GTPase activation protein [Cokeromyces recurvatus]
MMINSNKFTKNENMIRRAVTLRIDQHNAEVKRLYKRYSMSLYYSLVSKQDIEVEDELAQVQKTLRELKSNISIQSKKNFLLEKDVRFLDSRIALLIQNRMALHEHDFISQVEDNDATNLAQYPDNQIDALLQTVMFTLYGNQYESREENLLLTMFQNVLAAQFESTMDFGSSLRANTPASRMLTTYTRRGPGQSYLKSVLSGKINELIEQKELNLQINPLKVYEEIIERMERENSLPPGFNKSVTPEVAAANTEVQAIIEPRIKKLIELANEFLTVIIQSLDKIPYGIRWICKQIRSLTKRKYPNATDSAISSLIGGFFFLRFINPAIVTPQAYMLIESYPGTHPRTTLTLIAKMLQNLANKPSYSKETYMIPTNLFVNGNKQRMNQFLDDICKVSDFYETLEMDQYMALSRKDISLHITLNEMYTIHHLLQQHIHKMAPEPTHRLRILLQDLSSAPKLLSRSMNKSIRLLLFSRWETSPIMMDQHILPYHQCHYQLHYPIHYQHERDNNSNSITQNDIMYMEAKSIYVQIIRSLPHTLQLCHHDTTSLDLIKIAQTASSTKDTLLVNKGIKALSLLKNLENVGIISSDNHYELLVQEIQQELIQLGNLKDHVISEIKSLKQVYKTIQDHNDYLSSQLETYKAYLQNVRMQSTGGSTGTSHGSNNSNTTTTTTIHSHQINHDTTLVSGYYTKSDLVSDPSSTNNITTNQSTTSSPFSSKSTNQQQPPNLIYDSHTTATIKEEKRNHLKSNDTYIKRRPLNGPFKFSHQQLEREGILVGSEVPDYRRANIYLMIQSPITGTFIISLHYKGREKPILEIDLKLDDLLERQKEQIKCLDLEYVKLNVNKTIQLINKSFKGKSRLSFF